MTSDTHSTARRAGTLYFVMAILMVIGYMYLPTRYLVPGDASATARKIAANEFTYRLALANALVAQLMFVVVVLTLYRLFRDVDRSLARIMAGLVGVGVAAELVTIGLKLAPLTILGGDAYWSAFTQPQLDALAYGFLRVSANLGLMLSVIWGLWLFPFGLLTVRSGFFPGVLGYLLMVAGAGYVITCTAFLLFPEQSHVVNRLAQPMYFGEFPIILWMMIVGARPRDPSAPASGVASRHSY
jgi:hypothetical protein